MYRTVLLNASCVYLDSNDVYDFDTGADKNKKESVVNLAGRLEMVLTLKCLSQL